MRLIVCVCVCVCVCVRVLLPGCWYCVYWVLSAGQSEGVKEHLLILATHLFYWKSLDCFCSAPRLPLSVSLPLMKLQMNWSTYWLLSFSPPLTHRPPQCLCHTSWLSLCMSLSLLLSLSSLIPLFLPSSHASILIITFATLSPFVLILPILSVPLLTSFSVHLRPLSSYYSFTSSSPPLSSSTYKEGNVLCRCCLPTVDKSILMDWLTYMTHSDGLRAFQHCPLIHGQILKGFNSCSDVICLSILDFKIFLSIVSWDTILYSLSCLEIN